MYVCAIVLIFPAQLEIMYLDPLEDSNPFWWVSDFVRYFFQVLSADWWKDDSIVSGGADSQLHIYSKLNLSL
jgi:hypothetical protein